MEISGFFVFFMLLNRAAACPQNKYGENCDNQCHCFQNKPCDSITGQCPNKKCTFGWTGSTCSEACDEGWFGLGCEKQCHCLENIKCNKINGLCENNMCQKGWGGAACQHEYPFLSDTPKVRYMNGSFLYLAFKPIIPANDLHLLYKVRFKSKPTIETAQTDWEDFVMLCEKTKGKLEICNFYKNVSVFLKKDRSTLKLYFTNFFFNRTQYKFEILPALIDADSKIEHTKSSNYQTLWYSNSKNIVSSPYLIENTTKPLHQIRQTNIHSSFDLTHRDAHTIALKIWLDIPFYEEEWNISFHEISFYHNIFDFPKYQKIINASDIFQDDETVDKIVEIFDEAVFLPVDGEVIFFENSPFIATKKLLKSNTVIKPLSSFNKTSRDPKWRKHGNFHELDVLLSDLKPASLYFFNMTYHGMSFKNYHVLPSELLKELFSIHTLQFTGFNKGSIEAGIEQLEKNETRVSSFELKLNKTIGSALELIEPFSLVGYPNEVNTNEVYSSLKERNKINGTIDVNDIWAKSFPKIKYALMVVVEESTDQVCHVTECTENCDLPYHSMVKAYNRKIMRMPNFTAPFVSNVCNGSKKVVFKEYYFPLDDMNMFDLEDDGTRRKTFQDHYFHNFTDNLRSILEKHYWQYMPFQKKFRRQLWEFNYTDPLSFVEDCLILNFTRSFTEIFSIGATRNSINFNKIQKVMNFSNSLMDHGKAHSLWFILEEWLDGYHRRKLLHKHSLTPLPYSSVVVLATPKVGIVFLVLFFLVLFLIFLLCIFRNKARDKLEKKLWQRLQPASYDKKSLIQPGAFDFSIDPLGKATLHHPAVFTFPSPIIIYNRSAFQDVYSAPIETSDLRLFCERHLPFIIKLPNINNYNNNNNRAVKQHRKSKNQKKTEKLKKWQRESYLQHQYNDNYLQTEFSSFPTGFLDSVDTALKFNNIRMNRTVKIIPYDRNRVKLLRDLLSSSQPFQANDHSFVSPSNSANIINDSQTSSKNISVVTSSSKKSDQSFSDYYNASYVRLLGRSRCIVAQSPNNWHMPSRTGVVPFWKMIEQQGIVCIVNLSNIEHVFDPAETSLDSQLAIKTSNSMCSNLKETFFPKIGSAEKYDSYTSNKCNKNFNNDSDNDNAIKPDDSLLSENKMLPYCSSYWPQKLGGKACYGTLLVELVSEDSHAHYVHRQLLMKSSNSSLADNKNTHDDSGYSLGDRNQVSCRTIHQFDYIHWSTDPSHPPIPSHHIHFLNFLKHTQKYSKANLNLSTSQPSLMVHSKLAASRCGIFLALDSLITQGRHLGYVDVKRCVALLKSERIGLLQSIEQYRFIYECLAQEFDHSSFQAQPMASHSHTSFSLKRMNKKKIDDCVSSSMVVVHSIMKQVNYLPSSLSSPTKYGSFISCSHSSNDTNSILSANKEEDSFIDKANNLSNLHHINQYYSNYLNSMVTKNACNEGNLMGKAFGGEDGYVLFDTFEDNELFLLQMKPDEITSERFWHHLMVNRVSSVVAMNPLLPFVNISSETTLEHSRRMLLELVANGRMVCGTYSVLCISVKKLDTLNTMEFELEISVRNKVDCSYSWMVEKSANEAENMVSEEKNQQKRRVQFMQVMNQWSKQREGSSQLTSFLSFFHYVRMHRMRMTQVRPIMLVGADEGVDEMKKFSHDNVHRNLLINSIIYNTSRMGEFLALWLCVDQVAEKGWADMVMCLRLVRSFLPWTADNVLEYSFVHMALKSYLRQHDDLLPLNNSSHQLACVESDVLLNNEESFNNNNDSSKYYFSENSDEDSNSVKSSSRISSTNSSNDYKFSFFNRKKPDNKQSLFKYKSCFGDKNEEVQDFPFSDFGMYNVRTGSCFDTNNSNERFESPTKKIFTRFSSKTKINNVESDFENTSYNIEVGGLDFVQHSIEPSNTNNRKNCCIKTVDSTMTSIETYQADFIVDSSGKVIPPKKPKRLFA